MATRYYLTPFATSGDVAAVPDAIDTSAGTVSIAQGYGPNYQADPGTTSGALLIERTKFNQIIQDITGNLQQYQQFGTFPFITSSMNGGTPFSYSKNARVLASDGNVYMSLVGTNTTTPPSSSWALLTAGSAQVGRPYSNLSYRSTSATTLTGSVGSVLLTSATGAALTTNIPSTSLSISTSNAVNGQDTANALPSNGFGYLFAISNGTTKGFYASGSLTPTLPSGYTYSALLGELRTVGSNLAGFQKLDSKFTYTNAVFSSGFSNVIYSNVPLGTNQALVWTGLAPTYAQELEVSVNVSLNAAGATGSTSFSLSNDPADVARMYMSIAYPEGGTIMTARFAPTGVNVYATSTGSTSQNVVYLNGFTSPY